MNLQDVLTDDSFTGLTAAECVTALDATVEVTRDATAYMWSRLNIRLMEKGLPLEIVMSWNQLLPTLPGGSMLGEMLRAGGVDLTREDVRGALSAVIGTGDAATDLLLNTLLEIGIETGKNWVRYGLESLPVEADIVTARAIIQNTQEVATLFNELLYPLLADETITVERVKTAVANWSL